MPVHALRWVGSGAPAESGPSRPDPRLRRAFETHLDRSAMGGDAGVILSVDANLGSGARLPVTPLNCGVGAPGLQASTAQGIAHLSSIDGCQPIAVPASCIAWSGIFTTETAAFAVDPFSRDARLECEIMSGVWTGTTLVLEGRAHGSCAACLVVGIPDRLWRASANKWADLAHELRQAVQGTVVIEPARRQAASHDVPG